jgi:outer membrane protein
MRGIIGFFVVFAGVAMAVESSTTNIGFVDLRKALDSVDAYKSVKSTLDKDLANKKSELEKAQQTLQKDAEQFDKKAAILNDGAKASKQAELQKRFAELQKNAAESQMELQKRERDLTQPLLDEMRSVIETVGREKNFTLVLNEAAVLYAKEGSDITSQVVDRFNAKHKGKSTDKKKKSE